MKTKTKVCADRGETWRCDPSPMVIDETWRAIGCEPQTMLCDMCLSSNYGWLRPGADPDDIVPLFDPPHRSVAQIGAVKVGRAQTIGRPHLWRLPDRIDTEGKIALPGTTRGRCRPGSGTRTSSTRCVTPNLRRIDLRTSGDENRAARPRNPAAHHGGVFHCARLTGRISIHL